LINNELYNSPLTPTFSLNAANYRVAEFPG